MAYQVGQLNQRVTIRRETRTPDDYGGATVTWSEVATVWAHVRPLSGRERVAAEKLTAETRMMIVIRARADLTEADVMEWAGRRANIRYIKTRPREPFLEVEVEFGVAA